MTKNRNLNISQLVTVYIFSIKRLDFQCFISQYDNEINKSLNLNIKDTTKRNFDIHFKVKLN